MEITITKDGEIKYVHNDKLAGLAKAGVATTARASQVQPQRIVLRIPFRILRRLFGEKGRVSDWTRRWPCVWMADLTLSGGPVKKGFYVRQDAIDFEIEWLNAHNIPLTAAHKDRA